MRVDGGRLNVFAQALGALAERMRDPQCFGASDPSRRDEDEDKRSAVLAAVLLQMLRRYQQYPEAVLESGTDALAALAETQPAVVVAKGGAPIVAALRSAYPHNANILKSGSRLLKRCRQAPAQEREATETADAVEASGGAAEASPARQGGASDDFAALLALPGVEVAEIAVTGRDTDAAVSGEIQRKRR